MRFMSLSLSLSLSLSVSKARVSVLSEELAGGKESEQ